MGLESNNFYWTLKKNIMPLFKGNAIVLRSMDLFETDRLITFMTEDSEILAEIRMGPNGFGLYKND